MKKLLPWAAVFVLGTLLGVVCIEFLNPFSEESLNRQKAELARLTADLQSREARLVASQTRLDDQAASIHQAVIRAKELSAQVLDTQVLAVDRLKKLAVLIRQLEAELKAIN